MNDHTPKTDFGLARIESETDNVKVLGRNQSVGWFHSKLCRQMLTHPVIPASHDQHIRLITLDRMAVLSVHIILKLQIDTLEAAVLFSTQFACRHLLGRRQNRA